MRIFKLTSAAVGAGLVFSLSAAMLSGNQSTAVRLIDDGEAAQLMGASCDYFDDEGEGCTTPCDSAGRSYQYDGNWWYSKYGELNSQQCGNLAGCGFAESVDQAACDDDE